MYGSLDFIQFIFSAFKKTTLNSHQNAIRKKTLPYEKTLTYIGTSRKKKKKKKNEIGFFRRNFCTCCFSLPTLSLKSLQETHSSLVIILCCKNQSSRSPKSVAVYPLSPTSEINLIRDHLEIAGSSGRSTTLMKRLKGGDHWGLQEFHCRELKATFNYADQAG